MKYKIRMKYKDTSTATLILAANGRYDLSGNPISYHNESNSVDDGQRIDIRSEILSNNQFKSSYNEENI